MCDRPASGVESVKGLCPGCLVNFVYNVSYKGFYMAVRGYEEEKLFISKRLCNVLVLLYQKPMNAKPSHLNSFLLRNAQ